MGTGPAVGDFPLSSQLGGWAGTLPLDRPVVKLDKKVFLLQIFVEYLVSVWGTGRTLMGR